MSVVPCEVPSASKLRRKRATMTKEKLFGAAQSQQSLHLIHSQLVMLTSNIGNVVALLSSVWQGGPYSWIDDSKLLPDPAAPTFWSHEFSTSDVKSDMISGSEGSGHIRPACLSDAYFEELQASMDDENFSSQLLQLMGSWEALSFNECQVSQHSSEITTAGPNAVPTSVDSPVEDSPEFNASQMHSIIDMTIARLKESPDWLEKESSEVAALTATLKSRYELCGSTLYSRSQVKQLTVLIGRYCGEVFARKPE